MKKINNLNKLYPEEIISLMNIAVDMKDREYFNELSDELNKRRSKFTNEILTFGDCSKEFKRLGINPQYTWSGQWNKDGNITVIKITKNEFNILCDENESEIKGVWKDCAWRWFEGCILGKPSIQFIINDKEIMAWDIRKNNKFKYDNLLEYLDDQLGALNCDDTCALTMDLARYNNMTLTELFTRYQGNKELVKIINL
jgi:hypothetical protein